MHSDGNFPQTHATYDVIEFFDDLLYEGVAVEQLLHKCALWTKCTVGLHLNDALEGAVATRDGRVTGGIPAETAVTAPLEVGGIVWLDRGSEPPSPRDTLILRRLQFVASVLLRSVDDREPSMSQAVLVEILVSSTTDRADRARALRILGYGGHLRVLAFVGSPADVEVVIAQLKTAGQRVHWLRMGDTWAITIDGDIPDSLGVPIGSYLAVGTRTPGLSAPKSWQTACLALLFTLPSSHDTGPYRREEAVAADVDRIGCFALLAQHIPRRSIADADEIRALDRLADEPGGAEMLRTLEAVAATESIRRAGSTIHMHHNTVRNRVERAEEALKFSVTEPYGRVRLMMSLILRRLRDAPVVPLGYPARED